ncbi:M48 family metalloprotease [Marinihelvus fidelis]|uniref:M48 family metalloprotease n=1 Tax=Marinihelvus fidelis TaxID=2613842 RepID=A0A5N0T3Z7_9GAMM|nr:M48 family metallopeptidase [Marinihelvus fidelis]KAA9129582.1 M48 family metalloprotease [Marinihelvus fidelis]
MNFFEHQDRSRRHTRWLVFLFILAVLAIIAAVDLALMLAFGFTSLEQGVSPFSAQGLRQNAPLLGATSMATGAVIGFASLFKTISLRGGGGDVARQLGGTPIEPDTRDPLKRRLINVVEEIALASGVPVPEVFVLEQEEGINAFAAGYSPADAAVAVTRGTLEKLDRSELQGVIAHEFSHILNGDMRLNIRLMGVLFGILLLSLIGRKVLYHGRYLGSSRDRNGAPILVIAVVLAVVGWIGMFFGRWIKASVSRSREYLADASAVQFTRDPNGIGGALKKIAVYSGGSQLQVDTEEVGHMLFGQGRVSHLFATHPPLMERIARVEPGFQPEELTTLAKRIQRETERQAEIAAREQAASTAEPGPFDAGRIIDQIGNPDFSRLLMAATVAASLPEPLEAAAHSPDHAPAMLLYSLLHDDARSREDQLLAIAQVMGADTEAGVQHLIRASGLPQPAQRLPLLETALPLLRRHPASRVQKLLEAIDRVIRVDGHIDVFEYLMTRLVRQYLWESTNPHRVRAAGRKSLGRLSGPVRELIAVLAWHGAPEDADAAAQAWAAGYKAAFNEDAGALPAVHDWIETMDKVLPRLDELSPEAKQALVQALMATVTADGELRPAELELMRATCAAVHVPIPMLAGVMG